MKKKWRGSLVIPAALLAGAAALRLTDAAHSVTEATPLVSEAYVWQRTWSEDLRSSLVSASPSLGGFTVLGTEVAWSGGQPRALRFEPRHDWLLATGRPCGLALRVGPFPGPFRQGDEVCGFLVEEARGLVERSRAAGLEPAELQLDFDCATSKLSGYRVWVEELRRAVRPVPLTITVLPAWMRSYQFRALARAADRFVLQVHSLERPRGPDEPLVLCDTRTARRWARQANRVGVPFRVALPIYGYDVGFDPAGRFLGLAADGSPRGWPEGSLVRTVRPDAAALAALVADWERERPALLEGLIWYRLPVGDERLNWSWPTLAALIAGSVPQPRVEARAVMSSSQLADIELENKGDGDADLAVRVIVRWSSARLVAADALAGFEIAETDAHSLTFVPVSPPAGGGVAAGLAPGSGRRVGWLRFDREEVVDVEIEPALR